MQRTYTLRLKDGGCVTLERWSGSGNISLSVWVGGQSLSVVVRPEQSVELELALRLAREPD